MRSKAPLALMEQAVMILVFALAAALCLRVFVWSDQTSKRSAARDRAVILAQTAAETIKSEGEKGDDAAAALAAAAEKLGGGYLAESQTLAVYYDDSWAVQPGPSEGGYRLAVQEAASGVPGEAASGVPGLARVRVWVSDSDGDDLLFELNVAWQTEVSP